MKKQAVLLIVFTPLFFFGLLSHAQSIQAARQQSSSLHLLTGPITSFAHALSGNITLKPLGRFFSAHTTEPGEHIVIHIKNLFTNETFATQTDDNGEYTIILPQGKYFVKPMDEDVDFFAPPFHFVNLHDDKGNVSFKGFILPH